MNKKYYSLYHNKEELKIRLKLLSKRDSFVKYIEYYEKENLPFFYYNNNYHLGTDRKALKELAIKIKNEWIADLQEKLEVISAIKV